MSRSPTHTNVAFRRDPDLPGVELRFAHYSEWAFRRHAHHSYGIALILEGRPVIGFGTGAPRAAAGQLVVLQPDEVHDCNPDPGCVLTYRMFYIAEQWLESVATEMRGGETCTPRFERPVIDDPQLFRSWETMHIALMEGREALEKESHLVENIAMLLKRHAGAREVAPPAEVDQAVATAREILSADLASKVPLGELSSAVGLSRFHLLRRFKEATGLPPHEYRMQLRVDHARQLLAEGAPIIDAALESGFADQSHFTRTFREFVGATPSQYQAGVVARV